MIKPLYKSFVPYLILLVVILVLVRIFDNYAERLTREPEVVYLTAAETDSVRDALNWHLENDIAIREEAGTSGDSLYRAAMKLYRGEQYDQADELSLFLLNQAPADPASWNLRGIISIRMMKQGEAENQFLRALELDQDYNEARINLASLYTSMHRYREAEEQYAEARTRDPYNPEIYYNLGLLYTHMELADTAIGAFRSSADLASGKLKSRALSQLGTMQLQMNDTLAARNNLNEAILLVPGNELARLNLALTYRDPQKREEELLKIYRLHPSSFEANYRLGELYRKSGLISKAEYHYKKALEKKPYHEKTMNELGDLLIEQNRLDEAELVLAGFAAGDTLPQSYFFQAKIAVGKGRNDEAIRLYQLAIRKSQDDYPEAHLNIAILYKQESETDKAISAYKEAIRSRPDYSLAYYNLALLYTETDSLDMAIKCYRESIRSDSTAEKSWYNLGRLYDRKAESASAIGAYRHALQISPGYMKAMLALGNAYLRNEDFESAIDAYQGLLERYPHYSKAWFNLGLAFTRQDEPDQAMEAYEKLIEVDPGDVRGRIN
ncbi:MAG: tetratricopeptide repeat protein, partial [Bacteroidales bacterium]